MAYKLLAVTMVDWNHRPLRHGHRRSLVCTSFAVPRFVLATIVILAAFTGKIRFVSAFGRWSRGPSGDIGFAVFGIGPQSRHSPSSLPPSVSSCASRRFPTTTSMSAAASTQTYEIPTNLKGLFAGSGVEGLSNPLLNAQIMELLPTDKLQTKTDVQVLYLGTATYDIPYFRDKQTGRFVDQGCSVSWLNLAQDDEALDLEAAARAIASADIILVGGGNTLFAIDRWNHLGLVPHLRAAMQRGCILTGGSAGAICWFDSGHSDSADPETYQAPMLQEYGEDSANDGPKDESSEYDPANQKEWKYLRCPGLGFVPGPLVCCPHHDKTQSNGVLRAHDFDQMLVDRATSSRKSVLGIGIDHYSALVVEGEKYRVYAIPDKPGSVSEHETFDVAEDGTPNGKPGIWIKRVIVDGSSSSTDGLKVEAKVIPPTGTLQDLLAYGGDNLPGQHNEENDANQRAVDQCRAENPSGRQF